MKRIKFLRSTDIFGSFWTKNGHYICNIHIEFRNITTQLWTTEFLINEIVSSHFQLLPRMGQSFPTRGWNKPWRRGDFEAVEGGKKGLFFASKGQRGRWVWRRRKQKWIGFYVRIIKIIRLTQMILPNSNFWQFHGARILEVEVFREGPNIFQCCSNVPKKCWDVTKWWA